ncbi:MAG: glutaredoxin 3 [Beijerinckiaceae bacterium]
MPAVTIYTKAWCPYCDAAKQLLKKKSIAFTEIPVRSSADQDAMAKKAGRSTVPQIWIGERHVGGCDDLYALDGAGELDRLLAA